VSVKDRRPEGGVLSQVFDVSGAQATRERRQHLGREAVMALNAIQRNARNYGEDNKVFEPPLAQLKAVVLELLGADGLFELEIAEDGLWINRQVIRFDAAAVPLAANLRNELSERGIRALVTHLPPPDSDLRLIVRLLSPAAPRTTLGPRGDPSQPLKTFVLRTGPVAAPADPASEGTKRYATVYANAAYFVSHNIHQLRVGGELIPPWAASRMVQDLVDLQRAAPLRFLRLARTKPDHPDRYWGTHAANVAVLAVTFGARLGLSKRRRHDLGMAALFHDVGIAAIPANVLAKQSKLDQKDRGFLDASPLFAARAVLRDREVHGAALERALAAYECHLDMVPKEGPPPDVGLGGRILAICESFDALSTDRPFRRAHSPRDAIGVMTTEQLFRFDPALVDLFVKVVQPLL
jgi:HD-GYP domain-containing protein (c-di-GMP phosphodiesterase class II)